MAINLIELFKSEIGDDLVKHASSYLNETPESTSRAVSGVVPSLLGSLAHKGSSSGGAEQLMGMLSGGNFDGSLLNNFGDIMKGGAGGKLDGMMSQGSGLLDSLLGGKQSGLSDMIANYAGVKPKSASSLMSMAGPLLMSLIGRRVMKNGLNVGGLMEMLGGQTKHIQSSMPAGLSGIGNLLGFKGDLAGLGDSLKKAGDSLGDAAGRATQKAGSAASAATSAATSAANSAVSKGTNWLPWAIGAAVVLIILYFLL